MSVPEELLAQADQAVAEGKTSSVSAYVAAAMRDHGKQGTLRELLDEWKAELGPPSTDDYAWADAELARVAGDTSSRRTG